MSCIQNKDDHLLYGTHFSALRNSIVDDFDSQFTGFYYSLSLLKKLFGKPSKLLDLKEENT